MKRHPRVVLRCALGILPAVAALLPACSAETEGLSAQVPDAGTSSFRDAATPVATAVDAGVAGDGGGLLVISDELHMVLVDLSDPAAPELVAEDGVGHDDEPLPLYALAFDPRGYLYTGRLGWIWIYRLQDLRFDLVGTFEAPVPDGAPVTEVLDLAVRDGLLFAALGQVGLEVFSLADPQAPALVAQIRAQTATYDLALLPGARVATYDRRDSELLIYDLEDMARPRLEGRGSTDWVGSRSSGMAAAGSLVAVNVTWTPGAGPPASGLFLFDVTDPAAPRGFPENGRLGAPWGSHVSIYTHAGRAFAYFANGAEGLVIVEAAEQGGAALGTAPVGFVSETVIVGDHLYVAGGSNLLSVYAIDGQDPRRLLWVSELELPVDALRVLSIPR